MSVTAGHIGNIVTWCGAIEMLINEQIKHHSLDELLANEFLKTSLHRRADILKKLLTRERRDLSPDYIKNLITNIKILGNERNIIAHNPLLSDNQDGSDMKISYFKNDDECEYKIDDINRVMELSIEVLREMNELNENIFHYNEKTT